MFIFRSKLDSYQRTQPAYYQALSENIDHVEGDKVFIKDEQLAFVKSHFEIKSKPKVNEEIRQAAMERFNNRPERKPQLLEQLETAGIPYGDAIAWITDKIGIPSCSGCEKRQVILNTLFHQIKEHGLIGVAKKIKDSFKSE